MVETKQKREKNLFIMITLFALVSVPLIFLILVIFGLLPDTEAVSNTYISIMGGIVAGLILATAQAISKKYA